jgi:hypothetical protein
MIQRMRDRFTQVLHLSRTRRDRFGRATAKRFKTRRNKRDKQAARFMH